MARVTRTPIDRDGQSMRAGRAERLARHLKARYLTPPPEIVAKGHRDQRGRTRHDAAVEHGAHVCDEQCRFYESEDR